VLSLVAQGEKFARRRNSANAVTAQRIEERLHFEELYDVRSFLGGTL